MNKSNLNQPRRHFLKTFAVTTAYSSILGADWFGTVLAEVKSVSRPSVGILRLKITDFPALQNDFGSVRIGTSRLIGDVPQGIFYPVLINRGPGNQFYALNSECTHAGCAVPPYNRALGSSTCPCHGSRYAIDGRAIFGPAFFPLQAYKVTFDGASNLTIEVPDWPHEITGSTVDGGPIPQTRFRLKFLAFANLEFEVLFRGTLADDWKQISFSDTADGPANQTVFSGNDDFASLYVDRTNSSGFYAVAIRIKPV